jgi:hypothetical protein
MIIKKGRKQVDGDFGVIACKHIAAKTRPCLLVFHHEDGDWSFTCGGDDHDDDYVFLHYHHLTDDDASIGDISDLPPGWLAERPDVRTLWRREKDEAIDSDE